VKVLLSMILMRL